MDLPQIPPRIARLPRDYRGFPVPWFVAWSKDGKKCEPGEGLPDFRVIDGLKFNLARRVARCWVCGEMLGRHRVFIIGPMCAVNRVISEPPSHRECAEWSVKACPFMSRPRMRRNEVDLPDDILHAPGFPLDRNPGAICLWETPMYREFKPAAGNAGVLFHLGDPVRVDWWFQGRPATRAEVLASIESGYPELEKLARLQGHEAVQDLARKRAVADRLLPALEQTCKQKTRR